MHYYEIVTIIDVCNRSVEKHKSQRRAGTKSIGYATNKLNPASHNILNI